MLNLPWYGYITGTAHSFVLSAAASWPEQAAWVPMVVLLILAAVATVDAFTEVVPDPLIFLGLVAVVGMQGMYVSWPFAAHHLAIAVAAGIAVWAFNEIWFRLFKNDILMMGDAKWTMLAVSCFDTEPVFLAWCFALALGFLKMMIRRLFGKSAGVTYFAPFLFVGLIASLYILRVSLNGDKIGFMGL